MLTRVVLLEALLAMGIFGQSGEVCAEFRAHGEVEAGLTTTRLGLKPGPAGLSGIYRYTPSSATNVTPVTNAPGKQTGGRWALGESSFAVQIGPHVWQLAGGFPLFLDFRSTGQASQEIYEISATVANLPQQAARLTFTLSGEDLYSLTGVPALVPRFSAFSYTRLFFGSLNDTIYTGYINNLSPCSAERASEPWPPSSGKMLADPSAAPVQLLSALDPAGKANVTAIAPAGVGIDPASVTLVRYLDPELQKAVPIGALADHGREGDSAAGDGKYTATLRPGDVSLGTNVLGLSAAFNGSAIQTTPVGVVIVHSGRTCAEFIRQVANDIRINRSDSLREEFALPADAQFVDTLDDTKRQALADAFQNAKLKLLAVAECRFTVAQGLAAPLRTAEIHVARQSTGEWAVVNW